MPQVTLRKLRLRNFLSHSDTELAFDRGVTVFIGRNGAGKSSILEAIYYALTGRGWRTRGNERKPLIKEGANAATVEAWFEVDGEPLYIRRTVSRRGRAETEVRFGKEVLRSDALASKRLRELMGLDHSALKMIAIVPQGGITELFVGVGGSERKSLIDRLLGLDAYEKAWEALGQYVVEAELRRGGTYALTPVDRQISAVKETIRKLADQINAMKKEYVEGLREARSLKSELSKLSRKVEEVDEALRKAQKELEGLREVERRGAEVEEALKHVERELMEHITKVGELKSKVEEGERELKVKGEVSARAGKLQEARELVEVEGKISDVTEIVKRREEELKEFRARVKALKELERKVKAGSTDLAARLEEAKRRERELRQVLMELREKASSLRTSIASKKEEASKLKEEVDEVVKDAALRLQLKDVGIEDLLKRVKEEIEETERREEILAKELERLKKEEAFMTERGRKIREDLEKLREGGWTGRCPLCGQPLTPEHVQEVSSKLLQALKEAEERLPEIHGRITEAEGELKEVKGRSKELSNIALRLERASKAWRDSLTYLRDAESLWKELRRIGEEVEIKEKELKTITEEISALEKELEIARKYESLKEAVSEETCISLENEVGELRSQLKTLTLRREILKKGLEEVFGEALKPEEFLNRAEEASEELRRLEVLEEVLKKVREELKGRERKVRELEDLRKSLMKEKEEIEAKLRKVKELEEAVTTYTENLMQLKEKQSSLQTQLKATEERVEGLREEVIDLQEDLRTLLKAWLKAEVLRWVRNNVLHKDKAPQKLRAVYLTHAEEVVRELLNSFNLQYSDVRIDEEFNIYLRGPGTGGEGIEIGRLSGGEKVVTSLLTLLALHKIVSRGRLGFLALDEPTEYLDDERRKTLIDVLKEFKGGEHIKQLVVVTHDEEVKEAADTMFEVINEGATSKVREVSLYE